MSTVTSRYKPLLFSEKLAPNGAGALTMCRGASLAMAYDAGTNGDWTTNPDGSRWGRAKIKNMLDKMRLATGEPLRDGYNQGHVDEFLKAMGAPPDTWQVDNNPWPDLIADLKSGFVVELAGNVRHTPADSPLRKYVNPVDHDILMLDFKDNRIAFIDPMTPHGTARYVRWAPADHFKKFGSEFAISGRYVAGRVKRGKYSDVAKAKAPDANVAALKQKVADLRAALDDVDAENILLLDRVQDIEDATLSIRNIIGA